MNGAVRLFAFVAALAIYGYFNPLRVEHVVALALFTGLVVFRPTRRIALTALPVLVFSLAYDFLRVFDVSARGRVSIGAVDALELRLFGISTPGGVIGPVEWLAGHTQPWLDGVGAVFYSTHLLAAIGVAAVLVRNSAKDPEQAPRLYGFLWGFVIMNMAAFVIQASWPVAPPWFDPATMSATEVIGNAAGLLRVDAMLGNHHFAGVYAKSSYVFGAMPSLHVAIPVWAALWLRGRAQIVAFLFALGMGFFAVYLGHHFILDVIAGALLAAVAYLVTLALSDRVEALQERIFSWGFDE